MARLDRMEGERDVAQLAATLGREFSYELLAAVATWTSRRSRPSWPSWCRRRSCTRRAGRPGAPTSSSTPCSKTPCTTRWSRASGSSSTGGSPRCWKRGSRRPPQTQPELLAHHFTEAGLTETAIGYWLKAGLRSRERSAENEAIGHLTRGLALLADAGRVARAGRPGIGTVESRWAPPTSRRAVMPRRRSARFSAGRASCASGSGSHRRLFATHRGHLGVAFRARRAPAVHGPGRRGDGIRQPARTTPAS